MILKKLFKSHDFNIESLLFKIHKELDLTTKELMVLLALINVYRKKNTFSLNALSRRIDYPSKDIGLCVDSLIEKGFLTLYLEANRNKKTKEVFHLDDMFIKIEKHIANQKNVSKETSQDHIKKIIIKLEQYLNRMLRPKELEDIRQMLEENDQQYDAIYQIIEQLKERVSIKRIQQMLVLQSRIPDQKVDSETDKALDALYKSIK